MSMSASGGKADIPDPLSNVRFLTHSGHLLRVPYRHGSRLRLALDARPAWPRRFGQGVPAAYQISLYE